MTRDEDDPVLAALDHWMRGVKRELQPGGVATDLSATQDRALSLMIGWYESDDDAEREALLLMFSSGWTQGLRAARVCLRILGRIGEDD